MEELTVSGKHVKLRIALVIIFLAIAVAGFTIGIVSIGNNDEGFYVINASNDTEVPTYGKDISGTFYFDGKSRDIKNKVNKATDLLSSNLKTSYTLFDETKTYVGKTNIATINEHPNKEIEVSNVLYNVLSEALEKTHKNENYSIYSSAIYNFWDVIYSLKEEDKKSVDPKFNDDNRQKLEKIVEYSKENHVKIELFEGNKVKLFVSDECKAFRIANEISDPYISLNVLKEAYRLKMLADEFVKESITSGYFSTASGNLISLQGNKNPVYQLYDRENKTTIRYALINFESPSCATSLRRFVIKERDYIPFYELDDGTIRNSIININTGYGDQVYTSSTLLFKSINIVDSYYLSNYFSCLSENEIKEKIGAYEEEIYYIYTKNDNNKKCYLTLNLDNNISLNSVAEYQKDII